MSRDQRRPRHIGLNRKQRSAVRSAPSAASRHRKRLEGFGKDAPKGDSRTLAQCDDLLRDDDWFARKTAVDTIGKARPSPAVRVVSDRGVWHCVLRSDHPCRHLWRLRGFSWLAADGLQAQSEMYDGGGEVTYRLPFWLKSKWRRPRRGAPALLLGGD